MRVAIAGAGIAGLTSAIALAARGIEVELFERSPALKEVGAGIQLSPNAMAVLERLGVTGDLAGRLSEPAALAILDARSGTSLANIPLGATARHRYGAPYCTMHRADLQAALLSTARRHANVAFRIGAEVHDVRATDSGVVFKAAGQSHRSDILLAADGVHSRIRQSYFRHAGATPLGQTAWRATVPLADLPAFVRPDVVGLWLGAGGHLVHYLVEGGARLNIVVIAPGDHPTPPREPFGAKARRLMDVAPSWIISPLASVDPKLRWSLGRVTLVGDAAHGMAPSFAQGGAQAIEDAWVIAASIAAEPSPARALARFESTRRPRVQRISSAARFNLNAYGASGVPAFARNMLLRVSPANLLLARLDWLFGWHPP